MFLFRCPETLRQKGFNHALPLSLIYLFILFCFVKIKMCKRFLRRWKWRKKGLEYIIYNQNHHVLSIRTVSRIILKLMHGQTEFTSNSVKMSGLYDVITWPPCLIPVVVFVFTSRSITPFNSRYFHKHDIVMAFTLEDLIVESWRVKLVVKNDIASIAFWLGKARRTRRAGETRPVPHTCVASRVQDDDATCMHGATLNNKIHSICYWCHSLGSDVSDHFFWSEYRVNRTRFHSLSSEVSLGWSYTVKTGVLKWHQSVLIEDHTLRC